MYASPRKRTVPFRATSSALHLGLCTRRAGARDACRAHHHSRNRCHAQRRLGRKRHQLPHESQHLTGTFALEYRSTDAVGDRPEIGIPRSVWSPSSCARKIGVGWAASRVFCWRPRQSDRMIAEDKGHDLSGSTNDSVKMFRQGEIDTAAASGRRGFGSRHVQRKLFARD